MKTFCRYYNDQSCASCELIEVPFDQQLQDKEAQIRDVLPAGAQLLPSVQSSATQFRNKAKLVVTGTLEHPILGLTGTGELDQGREILECPLHHPAINKLIQDLPEFIQEARLTPYRIKERKGELKGLIIYFSSVSLEIYLRLILRSRESLDRIPKHLSKLKLKHPGLTCISANIQPIPHAVLEGEEEIFLTPQHFIRHQFGDVPVSLDPRGFVQTNHLVASELYAEADRWVKELHPIKFCELFSGQGAFSFACAESFQEGLGIEINKEAVQSASLSAQQSGTTHLRFLAADAASVKSELNQFSPDVLLVNPPRRGLGQSSELILECGPEFVLYSSCSPESLIQDLKTLSAKYQVKKARVFDMFPHTRHFETLLLLQKS